MANSRSQPNTPIAVGFQGGAMLGGYLWGMAAQIAEHWTNAEICVGGGTSIGGATAISLVKGLTLADKHPVLSQKRLVARQTIDDFWNQFSSYLQEKQNHVLADSLVHHALSKAEDLMRCWGTASISMLRIPTGGFMEGMSDSFRHASQFLNPQNHSLVGYSIMGRFLESSKIFDFDQIAGSMVGLFLNATDVSINTNPFSAAPHQEQIFSNRQHNRLWLPITQQAVEATGNLPYVEARPTQINERRYRDGAFVSNPPLLQLAAEADRQGIRDVVVLRTRPTNSLADERIMPPVTQNHTRAFFNGKTDDHVMEIARAFPKMRIWVIEPSRLEIDKDAGTDMQKVEFDYSSATLAKRRTIGFNAAAAAQKAFNDPQNRASGVYIVSSEEVRYLNPFVDRFAIARDATQGTARSGRGLLDARA